MVDAADLVSIPVPRKYLGEIYSFVGSLESPDAPRLPDHQDPLSAAGAGWPTALIERQYRESPESMKKFQQWLAAHPGQEFTTREIASALNAERGWNTIAGMLGAYGNRVRNRYKRTTFPFQSRWDFEAGQARHSMTPEVAEIIGALLPSQSVS